MARSVSRVPRPPLHPAPSDTAVRGAIVATAEEFGQVVRWVRGERRVPREDAAARAGVSRDLLRDLERAARGVSLAQAINVLASFGVDVVLVPRDPALSLRDPRDKPAPKPPPTVTRITRQGFTVVLHDEELLLQFDDYPWFRHASIDALTTVERPSWDHLHWPKLDVDLSLRSIHNPSEFTLKAR